jgi:hypothetical protein
MRLPRILLLLAALGLACLGPASCAGRERGPLFLDGQGGAQRARPAGEGRYLLKRSVPPGAADRAFYLRYRPAAEGAGAEAASAAGAGGAGAAELRVLDSAGGVLARAELAGGPAAREVSQQVALPPGSRVAGFSLPVEAGRRPEILEAGLARPFAGFELARGRLRRGIGVQGLLLPPGSMQVELAPESYGAGDQGWRIELEYELAGPADWAGLRLLENGQDPPGRARARLTAAAGGRRAAFELDALPGARRWFLHPGTIGFAPARLALRPLGGSYATVRRLEVVPHAARAQAPAGPALEPLAADPATVLHYDPRYWRQPDYELFAWERFPGILILDTADYAVQDRFFKRLAFFVEKEGYRGRLVTEQEVRGLHGYNAHDYRAEDLDRFFSAADDRGFALNREEELLRAILAANGILGGQGAVLSISRESSAVLRDLLLTHEAFHGLFFTLPRYREACQAVWEDLQGPERRFWSLFLDWGSYDYRDAYLAANEMQAYLFQQSRAELNFYFRHLTAGRLERAFPREAPWLRELLGSGGGGFETAFDRLAPALRREAGLQGGRVLEWRRVP